MGEESLPAFVLGGRGVTEQRIQRRLAAILAADVAGYSRLVGADEVGTLDRTRAIRADSIDPKIHEHRGRIVLGWGGEAEHAIEWGERGNRLSPFDPWITLTLHGISLGHFLRGRHEEAATTVRRAIRNKPGFSISHSPDFFRPPAHSRRHLSCRLSQLELDRSARLLLPHGRPDPPLSSGRANGVFPKCG
jgi:hypothetical protein